MQEMWRPSKIYDYDPIEKRIIVIDEATGRVVGKLLPEEINNHPEDLTWLLKWGYKQKTPRTQNRWKRQKTAQMGDPVQSIQTALQNDPAARDAYVALSRAGGHVYVVGGAVRDAFLGNDPKDVDLMVVGLPSEQVQTILGTLEGRVDLTGKSFGVYRYRNGENEVEVALPRTEQSSGDAHRDFDVNIDHELTPEQDLARRDFTGNAMAYNIDTNDFLDPYNGRQDLQDGVLRTVSPNSFKDDPLRIVRAIVQAARHGLEPDLGTLEQMRDEAAQIRFLPGERIQMELDKLMTAPDPVRAIEIAQQTGVLDYMIPELSVTFGVDQNNPHHDLDVGDHLLEVFRHMTNISNDPDMRLAALLHDIGKPDSMWLDEKGNGHFYEHPDHPGSADHHELGAQYAEELMRRLKYPNDRIDRVTKLIRHHMFPAFNTKRGARKFLQKVGDEQTAWDLLRLRMADLAGKGRQRGGLGNEQETVKNMMDLLNEVIDEKPAFSVKDLAVNGNDLRSIGVPVGPEIGEILRLLLDMVVEHPELNTKEELLGLARQYTTGRKGSLLI
jgi:tRNA nucleotidyltransferase (CCA-adding enzyme)